MYDQSFLELEEIMGDQKWSFKVLESKYLTCKGAKKWEHAENFSNGMRIYHPNRIDGWINQAKCLYELHGPENAVEVQLFKEPPNPELLPAEDLSTTKREPGIGFEPTTHALRMRCSTN